MKNIINKLIRSVLKIYYFLFYGMNLNANINYDLNKISNLLPRNTTNKFMEYIHLIFRDIISIQRHPK